MNDNLSIFDFAGYTGVALGIIFLSMALVPTHRIYKEAQIYPRAWRSLFAMIFGFITGYAIYLYTIFLQDLSNSQLVVCAIFFCGALFVLTVSKVGQDTISEISRVTALERHRSSHDDLTGLPNRQHFTNTVNEFALADSNDKFKISNPFAVFLMDLDRFKLINDTLGHGYGDILLQEVAARLRKVIGNKAILSRLGGDEFGLLLEDVHGVRPMYKTANDIKKILERPFIIEGHPTDIGISIGMASFPDHGRDGSLLIKRAEIAMYVAKESPERCAHYTTQMDTNNLNHLSIIGELRSAIENDELTIHFQPQVDIGSGQLEGVEALIRWPHKKFGLMPPDDFLPIAEQSGLINPLNRWVIDHIGKQIADWMSTGKEVPVSVNVSVTNLQDPSFFHHITQCLEKNNIPARLLRLEITESALMEDPKRAMGMMERLADIGIEFSIDDFGTGYSSLAYLKLLPASEIKIDKSFVQDMNFDDNDAVIVRATIDLAHNMGRRVVAEGVEDKETFDLLYILGCDIVQGFLISRPMPALDFYRWINKEETQKKTVCN